MKTLSPEDALSPLLPFLIGSALAAGPPRPHWDVDVWGTRDGMPQMSATGLAQGETGLMWVSTFGGLTVFDGHSFTVLDRSHVPGLDAIRVRDVEVLPDGSVWLATLERGLLVLRDGAVTQVGPERSIGPLSVSADGAVWVYGDGHAWTLDAESVRSVALPPLTRSTFSHLPDGGVVAYQLDGTAHCLQEPCPPAPPAGTRPLDITTSHTGTSLLRTTTGLFALRDGAWVPAPAGAGVDTTAPNARIVAWDGQDWVVDRMTLTALDGSVRVDLQRYPQNESRWNAISTFVDREDGLWIGTDGSGLMRLQRQPQWQHGEAGVYSVVQDDAGRIWFGGCHGLDVVGQDPPPVVDDLPRCPLAWSDGRGAMLVLGGRDNGTRVVRWKGDRLSPVLHVDSPKKAVQHATEGPWFTVEDALYFVPAEGPARLEVRPGAFNSDRLHVIQGDEDGAWLQKDDGELVFWTHGGVTRRIRALPGERVRHMIEARGLLWLGTYGAGLLAVRDDEVVARITPREGLCDHAVSHLFDVGDGHLWFNSNLGLAKVSLDSLVEVVGGTANEVRCTLVTNEEGNGSGGLALPDGRILAPTIHGLEELDTAVQKSVAAPGIRLSLVRYDEEMLSDGSATVEGPGDLDIRFSAQAFRNNGDVRYRYRLTGLQPEWSPHTTAQEVHFARLPPGTYRFEVQARTGGGVWSEVGTFELERLPAWWESWWFRLGVPVSAVLIVLMGFGWALTLTGRHNRRLAREVEERRKAERELQLQQAENQRVQETLERTRRLEALGRLAGGVAHDFNNLLAVVAAHGSTLWLHPDPEVRETGGHIQAAVDRAADVTRQLLAFGRLNEGETRVLELGQAIREVEPLLRRLIRSEITLDVQVHEAVGVRIDRGHIDQILTNLLTNARDAIEGAGTVRIEVHRVVDAAGVAWAALDVTDDGSGIPEGIADRVFDPYFTTKAQARGTGLGLATTLGAAQHAGGRVEVFWTHRGKGTSMRVLLPEVPLPREASPEPRIDAPPGGCTLRVLVVDDDEAVLRAVTRMLRRMGHLPVPASDASSAAEQLAHEVPDVVLCDVMLQGTTGPEVMDALKDRLGDASIVYMTGYDRDALVGRPDAQVLRKPFDRVTLDDALTEAMHRAGATA